MQKQSTKKKTTNQKVKPTVFLVSGDETSSGMHEVSWAADGDLNKAYRTGNYRKFSKWDDAEKFKASKEKELGIRVASPNPRPTRQSFLSRLMRISPKTPRLR